MTILVTGANGLLGSNLVNRLVEMGEDVVATDLRFDNPNLKSDGYRKVPFDLRELVKAYDFGTGYGPRVTPTIPLPSFFDRVTQVYHCAGIVEYPEGMANWPTDNERAKQMAGINIFAAGALARTCEQAGVERFLHVSSTAAYLWDRAYESAPEPEGVATVLQKIPFIFGKFGPFRWYDWTKYWGEIAVLAEARDMDIRVINPGIIIGKGDHQHRSIGKTITYVDRTLIPATVPARYFVNSVEDVTDGAIGIMAEGESRRNYMVGEVTLSSKELLEEISRSLGKPKRFFAVPRMAVQFIAYQAEVFGKRRLLERLLESPPSGTRIFDTGEQEKSVKRAIQEAVMFYKQNKKK